MYKYSNEYKYRVPTYGEATTRCAQVLYIIGLIDVISTGTSAVNVF